MSQQLINTGLADKGNGDPIRTAFTKVNENFAELYNHVSAGVVAGNTAPTAPAVGDLWWNSVDGRMYVYYSSAWVDASPVDGAGISSTNELVNGAHTVSLGSTGKLTFPNGMVIDPTTYNNQTTFWSGGDAITNGISLTTGEITNSVIIPGTIFADATGVGNTNPLSISGKNGVGITTGADGLAHPQYNWTFGTDGGLTFPDSTAQTTAWTGITGFGEGFSLTDADKIVTNKLYSTNLTQPTQHYRLELDTNGVVVLPDGSIINGSTIRGVAGTGELNYTGITIGPNSNDAEKTWMWVDHANAYISTNNSANTWTFGNNGSLTLPLGSTLGETPAAITVNIYGAGASAFNQTYTRTYGDPTYPDQYLGSNDCRIFRDSGTANKWRLREVSTDYYESDDLVTWTDFIGGADPAPTGIVSLKTADITVGTNTWTFGTDGELTLPDGGIVGEGVQPGTTPGLIRKIYSEYAGGYEVPNPTYSELIAALAGWTPDSISTTMPEAWAGIPEQTWEFTGYFTAPEAGTYTFSADPDDYYFIVIDGDVTPTPEINTPAEITLTQGQTVSYRLIYANVYVLGSLTLKWKNDASQTSYTSDFTGLLVTDLDTTIDITVNTSTWTFGTDGALTVPGEIKTAASTGNVTIEANDGTARTWTFGSNGSLTLPDSSVIASYKPVTVIAATTTAQTITDNASAAFIQFAETVDTANAFSPGTFTAPYTGYYQFNMSVYFSTTVSLTSTSFLLIDTNLDFTKQVRIIDGNWTGSYLHYSTVISATAGDAIRVAFRQVSGGDVEISSGSRLTIHRVSIG